MDSYYAVSPPVADLIGRSGVLRATVRLLLLPLVGFSWLALQAGLVKTLLLAACAAVAAGRLCRMPPAAPLNPPGGSPAHPKKPI